MLRYLDIKVVFFLFSNIAFSYMVSVVNGEIAPYAYFILPALYIVPAALFLNFLPMMFVVLFTAFYMEASTPIRAGLTAGIWLIAAFCAHSMRFRFRACDRFSITALFVLLNIIILFFYALLFPVDADSIFSYICRLSGDAIFSSLLLMLLAKFSISIPLALANIFGLNLSITEDAK